MSPIYCLICREDDLNEAPMAAQCAACGGRACAEHDTCSACGNPICIACNTVSPLGVPFAFAGDKFFHPHNQAE